MSFLLSRDRGGSSSPTVFSSPIYRWPGDSITAADGTSPVDWPETIAGLADATAVDAPTKETISGRDAVEYDGSNDGHDWTPDAQLPSGDEPRSAAVTVYLPSISGDMSAWGYGGFQTAADEFYLNPVDSGGPPKIQLQGGTYDLTASTTLTAGTLQTVGVRYDGAGTVKIYVNGSPDGTNSFDNLVTESSNHSIGYRKSNDSSYLNGYIIDVLVSDASEADQAFSDYHTNQTA